MCCVCVCVCVDGCVNGCECVCLTHADSKVQLCLPVLVECVRESVMPNVSHRSLSLPLSSTPPPFPLSLPPGNYDLVQDLLVSGSDPGVSDRRKETVTKLAERLGRTTLIPLLQEVGVDVDVGGCGCECK